MRWPKCELVCCMIEENIPSTSIKPYDRLDSRNHLILPEIRVHLVLGMSLLSKWKTNWIGHVLHRNCLLQQIIEGKIKGEMEVTGRRGRKRRKLLDDLKERRGFCHLKEEALDRTMWRACFGRGFGPLVRQTTK